eukprot:CAMPEP_0167805260 /NCGR_PEP_ID=MMETSP0111_2-20121227/21068_1 /TAXON_ID=91324 /ORGANISM="Lotharella globosa, Strain CCCM811" /LENGTH=271 /DNA_ID=CAMNT_0007702371 /DNA_START=186 /DNA_END=999 /DNA_ORIENTATION=+
MASAVAGVPREAVVPCLLDRSHPDDNFHRHYHPSFPKAVEAAVQRATTQNVSVLLRLHIPLDRVSNDPWDVISRLSLRRHRGARPDAEETEERSFVWASPNNSQVFVAKGDALFRELQGPERFTAARDAYLSLRTNIISSSLPSLQKNATATTDDDDDNDKKARALPRPTGRGGGVPWEGYPDGALWVPRLLIQSECESVQKGGGGPGHTGCGSGGSCFGTLTLRVEPNEKHAQVTARAEHYIQDFADWISSPTTTTSVDEDKELALLKTK